MKQPRFVSDFLYGRSVTVSTEKCPCAAQDTIKQLEEEACSMEEAGNVLRTFSDWVSTAQENFTSVAVSIGVVDRVAMERKMKKLEVYLLDTHHCC